MYLVAQFFFGRTCCWFQSERVCIQYKFVIETTPTPLRCICKYSKAAGASSSRSIGRNFPSYIFNSLQFLALVVVSEHQAWKVKKCPRMPFLTKTQLLAEVVCQLVGPCYCLQIHTIRVECSRLETVWGKLFFCWIHTFSHGDTLVQWQVATWPIVGVSSLLSTIINFPLDNHHLTSGSNTFVLNQKMAKFKSWVTLADN